MSNEEYLKLVQTSTVFKAMGKSLQEKISRAATSAQEQYAKILHDGDALLTKAKDRFLARSGEIVKKMQEDLKKIKRNKTQRDEAKSQKSDMQEQQKLLNQLNIL